MRERRGLHVFFSNEVHRHAVETVIGHHGAVTLRVQGLRTDSKCDSRPVSRQRRGWSMFLLHVCYSRKGWQHKIVHLLQVAVNASLADGTRASSHSSRTLAHTKMLVGAKRSDWEPPPDPMKLKLKLKPSVLGVQSSDARADGQKDASAQCGMSNPECINSTSWLSTTHFW